MSENVQEDTAPEEVPATGAPANGAPAADAPEQEVVPEAAAPVSVPVSNKRWYVVHVYSGMEKSVMRALTERIERGGMQEQFGQILVPTEEVVEMRNGTKAVTERRFFPGYVLVEMEMTDDTWHLVRDTPKVTGFLGARNKPQPITEAEAMRIVNAMVEGAEKPRRPAVLFEVGEQVRVSDGPFTSFNGTVEEVDEEKGRLKVSVSIFGRSTPVELEYGQVEKL